MIYQYKVQLFDDAQQDSGVITLSRYEMSETEQATLSSPLIVNGCAPEGLSLTTAQKLSEKRIVYMGELIGKHPMLLKSRVGLSDSELREVQTFLQQLGFDLFMIKLSNIWSKAFYPNMLQYTS